MRRLNVGALSLAPTCQASFRSLRAPSEHRDHGPPVCPCGQIPGVFGAELGGVAALDGIRIADSACTTAGSARSARRAASQAVRRASQGGATGESDAWMTGAYPDKATARMRSHETTVASRVEPFHRSPRCGRAVAWGVARD
jgi:hypothetical protein